jgi:hypothetical protein
MSRFSCSLVAQQDSSAEELFVVILAGADFRTEIIQFCPPVSIMSWDAKAGRTEHHRALLQSNALPSQDAIDGTNRR